MDDDKRTAIDKLEAELARNVPQANPDDTGALASLMRDPEAYRQKRHWLI